MNWKLENKLGSAFDRSYCERAAASYQRFDRSDSLARKSVSSKSHTANAVYRVPRISSDLQ